MSLIRLTLSGFTVFEDVDLEFDSGINVFIGPNGTGKTHALKIMYSTLRSLEDLDAPRRVGEALRDKIAGVFRPDDRNVGRVVRRVQGKGRARVGVQIDDELFGFSIYQSQSDPIREVTRTRPDVPGSVFLPSREVLALFEGFASLYAAREIAVDETYADAIAALGLPPLRGARPGVLGEVARDLERAIGGRVRRDGPRFYLRERSGAKVEAHLAAEGHRKIATLLSLISNGSLKDRAALFWDEPEANLHPLLARQLVGAIHKLAAGGVQVFLATHDYLVANEVSLMADAAGGASARFFAFSRHASGPSTVEAAPRLADLDENLLLEAIKAHNQLQRRLAVQAMNP